MESAPGILPALLDVLGLEQVEAERRIVGIDRVRAVQLLDALGKDVQQERELGLAADYDVPLQRNALLSFSKIPSDLP
jgi:hypothetical protein